MEEKSVKKKILIVDDEKGLVLSLSTLLKSQGYSVIAANDSLYGISVAHQEKPDLVILDVGLPAGGGLYVLKSLKGSIKTNDIPVLMLTGSQELALETKANNEGAAAFIRKPFEPAVLLSTIKEILNKT